MLDPATPNNAGASRSAAKSRVVNRKLTWRSVWHTAKERIRFCGLKLTRERVGLRVGDDADGADESAPAG
jgi:hypothetical protein